MYENDRYYLLTEEELEHFGIKGMKWGVRRTPEQLGHKREKTPEQLAKSAKRKAAVKKAASVVKKYGPAVVGGAAVAVFAGANAKYALTSQAGKAAISLGSKALSKALNVNKGQTYNNIQSMSAQWATQAARGNVTRTPDTSAIGRLLNIQNVSTKNANIRTPAAQRFQQDIQRYQAAGISNIGPNMSWNEAMDYLLSRK